MRTSESDELRLFECWTSLAKSMVLFGAQYSVAKSTHAGITWLKRIRADDDDRIYSRDFLGLGRGERSVEILRYSRFANRISA